MKTDARAIELARPEIDGLTLRTYRPGDAAALTELANRVFEHDDVPWRTDTGEQESWLSAANEHFDATRDMFLVEVDGALVANADTEWVDTTDGLREFRMGCLVDPAWRRRGIGTWLQRTMEAHIAENAAANPTDRPKAIGSWAADSEHDRIALLTRFGFQPVRYFFEMVRPTLDDIEEPVLPDGLEFRAVGDAEMRQLWEADIEAFRDHWGGFDGSEERFQSWMRDPKFDPSLFAIAWDGDEIAGGSINQINATENAAFNRQRGWP